ncbi:glycosyltransferase family 4 protein [Flavobacterium sp. 7A]|uniref:glycosyltransferase family 4 protein n=1 Tax=Flavobacterium sp. 7A TaxID=2940571 RepID=UPI00222605BB|nr:glycosyltransferase family 4 protein [Flavobacterium sp. 7A]MCW2119418.1 glycosyltransferase involved in cell wall biosynthesis [Flavobacterium sp. 7A]
MFKPKIIRTSTVALSLNVLLKGQLSFLNKYYEVIAVSGVDENLEEVATREMVKISDVKMHRTIKPFSDLCSLYNLYRLFRKEKPMIVHSITPKAGLLSMVAAKLAGVPIRMHTFTGLIFPSKGGLMKILLIKMDQFLCLCATNIYPEGKGVEKDLKLYNITRKPLKVLANGNVNGIDSNFYSPEHINSNQDNELRKSLSIKENDFVYIFVGRLVKDKGINELVNAFSKVPLENIKLLLVGDEEKDLDPLNDFTVEQIKNHSNIIAVGFQKDVRPYFNISHALVFPSYREGFPNVVLQAGAMGLPCIVSNISGCNEIIMEGINGAIIPVKDEEAILNKMIEFQADIKYYNALKNNAREMVLSRYEQTYVWESILNEYKQLINDV